MPDSSMSVMMRLREQTSEHHARAESKPFEQSLIGGTLPCELYVEMLGQRFLIHASLEAKIRRLRAENAVVANIVHESLFQQDNLLADLAFFGVNPERIEPRPSTSRLLAEIERLALETPMALLGVYYVFEGSKNGARFIARRIARPYGLTTDGGMRYLDPHGDEQRALWGAFKERMDAAAFPDDQQQAMVAAAQKTFDAVADLSDELYAAAAFA